ncbi:hypothetical protein I7I48_11340 [Histoplasma ohiense]|nr:hypothetical protein I7I48_11340 [Histoplasma ohiense (nom. inval.)]
MLSGFLQGEEQYWCLFQSTAWQAIVVPLLTGHRESLTVMASVEVELLSARHSQRDHIHDITDIGCFFSTTLALILSHNVFTQDPFRDEEFDPSTIDIQRLHTIGVYAQQINASALHNGIVDVR